MIFVAFCLAFAAQRVWAEGNGSTVTGAALYHAHCASCHGENGRGDGMVGAALRTPPADLTLLAQRNGGVFPEAMVSEFIDGTRDVIAHGPRTMPVWGMIFQNRETIHKLVESLRELQRT
ncbi:MAG TPA: c-type cytochrome [Candidatus Binatia bacterium]|nr:c-type cytochrome [Candidatus Binatia bacterium]